MAGAFFPQPELEVPEEEMGQHAGHHMVDPAGEFAHLVVVHPEFRFCFLKALFDSPANATQPYEEFKAGAQARIADEIGIRRGFIERPSDNEPHLPARKATPGENHSSLRELVFDRPFGSFRNLSPVPEEAVEVCGNRFKRHRILPGSRCQVKSVPIMAG